MEAAVVYTANDRKHSQKPKTLLPSREGLGEGEYSKPLLALPFLQLPNRRYHVGGLGQDEILQGR